MIDEVFNHLDTDRSGSLIHEEVVKDQSMALRNRIEALDEIWRQQMGALTPSKDTNADAEEDNE